MFRSHWHIPVLSVVESVVRDCVGDYLVVILLLEDYISVSPLIGLLYAITSVGLIVGKYDLGLWLS